MQLAVIVSRLHHWFATESREAKRHKQQVLGYEPSEQSVILSTTLGEIIPQQPAPPLVMLPTTTPGEAAYHVSHLEGELPLAWIRTRRQCSPCVTSLAGLAGGSKPASVWAAAAGRRWTTL